MTLILLFFSCSAGQPMGRNNAINKKEIVSKQISRILQSGNILSEDKIYVSIVLNDYLHDYLKKEKKFSEFEDLLLKEEFQLIFKGNNIGYMSEQLKKNNFDIRKVKLPKNMFPWDYEKEKKEIQGNGLKLANFQTKSRVFLSVPLISENKKFAIMAYSSGIINSMHGGINLYKKEDGKWIFYKRLEGWIA